MPNLVNTYSFTPVEDLVLIGSAVAAGGGTTLTVSSIPATFDNLLCMINGRCDGGSFQRSSIIMRFNGDSGSNYGDQYLQIAFGGIGATTHFLNFLYTGEIPNSSGPATYAGQTIYEIANYRNNNFFKTASTFCGYGNGQVDWYMNLFGDSWRNTTAINSIQLITQTGTFTAGTTFWVYGY